MLQVRRSFDELDTPLHEVTFCVVDLETTGGSPDACSITEVGAARFRAGECLGRFQTLVNPGAPISPTVTALTGITEAMVLPAPPVSEVLPTLAEFVGGAVLVGHNLRFDVSFLDAALRAGDRARVGLHRVDTVALARRLARDEVPDCRLGTLAHALGLDHQPTHRALDDVLATADLLHLLLERATAFGVTLLDDLLALPRLAAHPHAAKLRLTNGLPRSPGVYVLRDGQGQALDVGTADDLRREVRGLFSGDDPRASGPLLREVQAVDHVVCTSSLEATVVEVRLTQSLRPRRAHRPLDGERGRYVKVGGRSSARLTVARTYRDDGAVYLGPLASAAAGRVVVDALSAALACVEAEGGEAEGVDVGDAPPPIAGLARSLVDHPALVLSPLHRRVVALRSAGHYGQAERLRALGTAVSDAVRRHRRFAALRRAERVVVDLPDGAGVELRRGRLVRAWHVDSRATDGPRERSDGDPQPALDAVGLPPDDGPLPLDMADELSRVATWLEANAHRLRLVHVDGELSSPLPGLPSFAAGEEVDAGLRPIGDAAGLRCAAC